ncbi:DUF3951 domain-containing protein [Paenibacillus sp. 1001270B_150601_E10]|uniref:DUF3951 domain-containing protein n=1 Tax=Paenibacillus sp. 1001270B_150601_E10 TaxID=2787079 RepID=UPI00189EBE7F|nr:DUF3951 domain-containing protein [Paenibacillus sp. 1001270B_150601_E10]
MILLSLIVPILVLLSIIAVKIIRGRALPDVYYTPLDYITGQSEVEFHEEKEDHEEDDDQGEGKRRSKQKVQ